MASDFPTINAIVPYSQNRVSQIVQGSRQAMTVSGTASTTRRGYGGYANPQLPGNVQNRATVIGRSNPRKKAKFPGGLALFVGMGMLGAESPYEAARGGTLGAVDYYGWQKGAKAGQALFSATTLAKSGTMFAKIAGGAASFAGGMIGAYLVTKPIEYGIEKWEEGVQRELDARKMNWVGNTDVFDTQRAHTMRQTSLEAMNRGMMSARSMMGREAMMLHQ